MNVRSTGRRRSRGGDTTLLEIKEHALILESRMVII